MDFLKRSGVLSLNASTCLDCAGPKEGDNDGDDVDSELELQELSNAVVDITTPHHRLHNAREVVISQDDIRRLLRYIRTSDALPNT